MIKRGAVTYGPTAKQLGRLARIKISIQPETIDIEGYYQDGKRAALAERECDPGCSLVENITAYIRGYNS